MKETLTDVAGYRVSLDTGVDTFTHCGELAESAPFIHILTEGEPAQTRETPSLVEALKIAADWLNEFWRDRAKVMGGAVEFYGCASIAAKTPEGWFELAYYESGKWGAGFSVDAYDFDD